MRNLNRALWSHVSGPLQNRRMTDDAYLLQAKAITGRGATLNSFVILEDAAGFIDFATTVFGAREVRVARAPMPEGRLIHAEVQLGDSLLMLSDPQDGWDARPGLFQLWVSDIDALIERAVALGATVVTPPSPFYGSLTLARIEDPWSNLWWLYQPAPGQSDPRPAWEGGPDTIFRTVDEYMRAHAR